MNNDPELDELERMARHAPTTSDAPRGPEARRAWLKERAQKKARTKQAISLRLDVETLERLKELAGDGSYQTLINRVLSQWCDAMEFSDLLEDKLERLENAARSLESLEHRLGSTNISP